MVLLLQLHFAIEQHGGEQEVLGVFVIDLEHHDLLLIVAENGAVQFITGGPAYAGGVELDGIGHAFGICIELYAHAIHDAPALKLVDHPNVIGIRHKIHVDPAIIQVVELYPFLELHVTVINADRVLVPVVFENEDVTAHLTDYFKIGTTAVFPFRFGIGYSLSGTNIGKCGLNQYYQQQLVQGFFAKIHHGAAMHVICQITDC